MIRGINLLLTVGGLAFASIIAAIVIWRIAKTRRRPRDGVELSHSVQDRDEVLFPRVAKGEDVVRLDPTEGVVRLPPGAETGGDRIDEASQTPQVHAAQSSGLASAAGAMPPSEDVDLQQAARETAPIEVVGEGGIGEDPSASSAPGTASLPAVVGPVPPAAVEEHPQVGPPLSTEQGARPTPDMIAPAQPETLEKGRVTGSSGHVGQEESPMPAHSSRELESQSPVLEDDTSAVEGAPKASGTAEPTTRPRSPRQYRPPTRAPSAARADRGTARAPQEAGAAERAFRIEVRLVFERARFCRVSLLPQRDPSLPEEMVVTGSGNPPEMIALQDEWFQDVSLPDLGTLLRQGIEWEAVSEDRPVRWSLSGREIYVLCPHSGLNGFVSGPRLLIGEEHVVLCTSERLGEVRAAIALTGSPVPDQVDEGAGIPPGWIGLRGVVPRTSVPPRGGDILDVLRPLADVEIVLEGGIRLERSTWLSGHPPLIRLHGIPGPADQILIDGQVAVRDPQGGHSALGWDQPGPHQVWCTSASFTYSIAEGAENWDVWDAYAWSMGGARSGEDRTRPVVCGVLVRPPRLSGNNGRAILCPSSNPILLGAAPGEIEISRPRDDLRVGTCIGFPWFAPVWAAPPDPLRCDKRAICVILVGNPEPVDLQGRSGFDRRGLKRVAAWCSIILAAGRKGLKASPSVAETALLWRAYRRAAKTIWKRFR